MPTGYTADIEKGITFKEYALNCARAFGALIELRDEPKGFPIPEEFSASAHHSSRVEEAKTALAKLETLTDEEARRLVDEENLKNLKYHIDAIAANEKLRGKYDAMLAQAEAYVSPSRDHDEYKNFMIRQIRESTEFDCGGDYHQRAIAKLRLMTGAEWIASQRERLQHDVDHHSREYDKDKERAEARTTWVKQLRESLSTFS